METICIHPGVRGVPHPGLGSRAGFGLLAPGSLLSVLAPNPTYAHLNTDGTTPEPRIVLEPPALNGGSPGCWTGVLTAWVSGRGVSSAVISYGKSYVMLGCVGTRGQIRLSPKTRALSRVCQRVCMCGIHLSGVSPSWVGCSSTPSPPPRMRRTPRWLCPYQARSPGSAP